MNDLGNLALNETYLPVETTRLNEAIMSYEPLAFAINAAVEINGGPLCIYGSFKNDLINNARSLESKEGKLIIIDGEIYDFDAYVCMSQVEFSAFATSVKSKSNGKFDVKVRGGGANSLDVVDIIKTKSNGEQVWVTIFRTPGVMVYTSALTVEQRYLEVERSMSNMTYEVDKSYFACYGDHIDHRDPKNVSSESLGARRSRLSNGTEYRHVAKGMEDMGLNVPRAKALTLSIDPESMFAGLIKKMLFATGKVEGSREQFMAAQAFARALKYIADGYHFDNDVDRLQIVQILQYIYVYGLPVPEGEIDRYTDKFNRSLARSVAKFLGNPVPHDLRGSFVMSDELSAYPRQIDLLTRYATLFYPFEDLLEPLFGSMKYISFESPLISGEEGGSPYWALDDFYTQGSPNIRNKERVLPWPGITQGDEKKRLLYNRQFYIMQYERIWILSNLIKCYEEGNRKVDDINKLLKIIILSAYIADQVVIYADRYEGILASQLFDYSQHPNGSLKEPAKFEIEKVEEMLRHNNWPKYNEGQRYSGFGVNLNTGLIIDFSRKIIGALGTGAVKIAALNCMYNMGVVSRRGQIQNVQDTSVYKQIQTRWPRILEDHKLDILTLGSFGLKNLFSAPMIKSLIDQI